MLNLRRRIGERIRLTHRRTDEPIIVEVLDIVDGREPNVVLGFTDGNRSFDIRRVESTRMRSEHVYHGAR